MAIIWVSLQIGMLGFFSFETSPCHHVSTADMMVFCYMFPPKNNPSIVVHICFLYVDSCLWLTSLAGSTPHPYPLYTPKIHANTKNNRITGFPKEIAVDTSNLWHLLYYIFGKSSWYGSNLLSYIVFDIYIYDMYIYIHIYIYIIIYIYIHIIYQISIDIIYQSRHAIQ